jgi:hypothetical protein
MKTTAANEAATTTKEATVKETKHQDRILAEKVYTKTLAALKIAERGKSEEAYQAANSRHDQSIKELVRQEMLHPTQSEQRRADEKLRFRNRGLDV